jgi:hypothetical protein
MIEISFILLIYYILMSHIIGLVLGVVIFVTSIVITNKELGDKHDRTT